MAHHALNKMLWTFTTSAHSAGPFWLQFLSSDGRGWSRGGDCGDSPP